MPVKVKVVYCGGWGYGAKFRTIKSEIENEFGQDVEVVGESPPGLTGYLEVSVNGKLVHSRKNGDGYVDSDAKLQKIMSAIESAM